MTSICPNCQADLSAVRDEMPEACPRCGVRLASSVWEGQEGVGGIGGWVENSISSLVSLFLHMSLLLLFAFVTCNRGGEGGPGEMEVAIAELPQVELGESTAEQLETPEPTPEETFEVELDVSLDVNSSPAADSAGQLSLATLPSEGIAGNLAGSGGDLGGGMSGAGEGASFMGLQAEGQRFCIIADCSGSMAGSKLEYVKQEILETVQGLRGNSRFQLVFFNSRAKPFPQQRWNHPRRDFGALATWLDTVSAGGGTYPTPAFELAFQLKPRPDAIFFMTDGQFHDRAVLEIAALNRGGGRLVRIHTISFLDRSTAPLMQRIANDSGGKYRHVGGF